MSDILEILNDARQTVQGAAFQRRRFLPTVLGLTVRLGALAAAFTIASFGGWGIAAAFVIVGIVQYGFAVAVHEATHMGLLPWRRANEWAGQACGLAIGLELSSYRAFHLRHHRCYGDVRDPDLPAYATIPFGVARFCLGLGEHAAGISAARRFMQKTMGQSFVAAGDHSIAERKWRTLLLLTVVQGATFAALSIFGQWWWYPVLWLLPIVSVAAVLNRIRMFGEHAGLPSQSPEADVHPSIRVLAARTTMPEQGWRHWPQLLECKFVAPFNFYYHHEHHLYPWVPYYHLPLLHRRLRLQGYYSARPESLSASYTGTILRLCRSAAATQKQVNHELASRPAAS